MRIPSKIKVGGHVYTIELVDHELIESDCGEVNRARSTIRLRNDLTASQLEESFIHEVVHLINLSWDEERVEFISNIIYQILKDNKFI